jgi:hypothetical protein
MGNYAGFYFFRANAKNNLAFQKLYRFTAG